MKAKKMFFNECHLAGRQYYDVDEVWDKLHVGLMVRLEREMDNRYDANAVAVLYDDVDEKGTPTGETYSLGYIPRGENGTIAKLLEMGWGHIFECKICKINPDTCYEDQIHLSIRIKKNE